MPTETMTQRERWQAVVNREAPDRIPMYYRATDEASEKLMKYLQCSTMEEICLRLHIDQNVNLAPRYKGGPVPLGEDIYGRKYELMTYENGNYRECVFHPLAEFATVAEIEAQYIWPSADWFDYSGIPAQVAAAENRVIAGGGSEPFLIYKHLRGEEQSFIDLIEHPDIVHYCLEQLYGYCYERSTRIYEAAQGRVNMTAVAEDMGAQDRLLYSRAHLETFFFPYMKRMIDLAHQAGAKVNTHSDGSIIEILPDLIEMGVDIINPIQWRCKGMERERLKREFGDQLIFEGGVDNQYTLPFGTEEEVREEVRENIRILGAGGGYIITPCHNIQVVGPAENVVAMFDEGYEAGWA